MKFFIWPLFFLISLNSINSFAKSNWASCPAFYATAIQEVFWKSDADNSNGPDYHLKSGLLFSNGISVCQPGSVLKNEDWTKEIQTNLSPIKSVNSFKSIKSPEEFQKFLTDFGAIVYDQSRLNEVVRAYLAGKPLATDASPPDASAPNSGILVGRSKEQALIVLVTSDGKSRSATFMNLRKE